jgi:hypothetical protein
MVADPFRSIVGMRQIVRDQRMNLADEIARQRPGRTHRCHLASPIISRRDVQHAALLDCLNLQRVEIDRRSGLVLGQGPTLNGVGAKKAADDNLTFKVLRHLCQR